MKRLIRSKSILFVCDIQQNFAPKTCDYQSILQSSLLSIKAANILEIPIITTQHNKKIFGLTCKELLQNIQLSKEYYFLQKNKFSMIIPQIISLLSTMKDRNQIILIGMQAHICILQTCLDLLQKNYQVYLLIDAITSIRVWQKSIALKRMQKQGAILSTFQSSVFQLLKDSKDQKFKSILNIIKNNPRIKAISYL